MVEVIPAGHPGPRLALPLLPLTRPGGGFRIGLVRINALIVFLAVNGPRYLRGGRWLLATGLVAAATSGLVASGLVAVGVRPCQSTGAGRPCRSPRSLSISHADHRPVSGGRAILRPLIARENRFAPGYTRLATIAACAPLTQSWRPSRPRASSTSSGSLAAPTCRSTTRSTTPTSTTSRPARAGRRPHGRGLRQGLRPRGRRLRDLRARRHQPDHADRRRDAWTPSRPSSSPGRSAPT